MSKFGGGSSSSNDELIKQQKAEALKAERKEQDRQERLRAGRERIMAMFSEDGGSWTGPNTWQTVANYDVPQTVQKQQRYFTSGGGSYRDRQETGNRPDAVRTVTVANPEYGAETTQLVQGEGGTETGLGQTFYDDFKNSILGYYTPEVERQHEEAQKANIYDLARRGLLKSSVAVDNAAELVREKADADTRVAADAENQTAGLRGDIANAEQNALALLQQTEDPTSAANAAATEVNAIQSRSPNFSPLGDLFSAAARSFAGWQNAQNAKRIYDSIPTNNPYTSQGRNVG